MSNRFLVYLIFLLIVFLTGLLNYKKLSSPFRLITIFVLITFISESLTRYFAKEFRNSCPIYHVYYPIHFLCITTFYGYFLKKSRTLISWSAPIFVLITFVNILYYQTVIQFPSNIILISSLTYVLCALALFKKMLLSVKNVSLFKQELFWFNLTTIITFTFTFLCWSFYNILLKANSTSTVIDIAYYVVLQYYIVIGISIFLNSRRNTAMPNEQ